MKKILFAIGMFVTLSLTGCGYNDLQVKDEDVSASWAEVTNQYKRRSDLIPSIVETVKGETAFEKDTLTNVIEARAKATAVKIDASNLTEESMAKFQRAQGDLTTALGKLMVVSEQYPQLKANKAFSDLRVELEGTENRIAVARNRYIDKVKEFNLVVRKFPTNLTAKMFDYKTKPQLQVDEKEMEKPVVNFSGK